MKKLSVMLVVCLAAAVVGAAESTIEMKIKKQYILLPVREGGAGGTATISLSVEGKEVRFLKSTLAESRDDVAWWGFLDVSAYKGHKVTLKVSGQSEAVAKLITQDDHVPGEAKWGSEATRPQFHFSQKVGWINDPNGMVYYDGEWHLYFQHNPVSRGWGNITWGHAVSKDLVHWEQLANVLHHRRTKEGRVDAMFSGGAAVDWKNTGGWKSGKHDVIIATWTSTGRGECIAYSNDKGRTFTEYEGNPIIKHSGRDPKPLWYPYDKDDTPLDDAAKHLGGHWVIAVYDGHEGANIAFYTSTDLKEWTVQSHLYGYYECAELFELPIDGDADATRWVVFAADARYAIGDFDGRKFTPQYEGEQRLHWGLYYASQLFSGAPDGRRIQVGWAKISGREAPFSQGFTFPTELTLRTTVDGIRMFGEPVKEIEKLHARTHSAKDKPLADEKPVTLDVSGLLFDIRAVFEIGKAEQVGLRLDGKDVFSYDAAEGTFMGEPLKPVNGKISVQVLIDRPTKEVFVNNGRMIVTGQQQGGMGKRMDVYTSRDAETRGVNYAYFEGDWGGKLPDFDILTPVSTGTVDYFDMGPRKRNDRFGFKFTGFVKIEKKGRYSLIASSDDGSRIYVGDKMIVDYDGTHSDGMKAGEVDLAEGMHPISVIYFEGVGREALHIGYAKAGAGNHGVDSVTAFAKGGKARLVSLEVHELNASWK
jgi:fructan beta-fructosidase